MAKKKPSRKQEAEDVRLLAYARELLDAHAYERYVREPPEPQPDELVQFLLDTMVDAWLEERPATEVRAREVAKDLLSKYAITGREQHDELLQRAREHPLVEELACGCVYDLEAQEFAVMCEQHRDLVEVQD